MSTRDRVKGFLSPQSTYEQQLFQLYARDNRTNVMNSASAFSMKNNVFKEIAQMTSDPIISSVLALVMETAFQPSTDDGLFKLSSPYKKVVEDLNDFHDDFNFDEVVLTIAYNLMLYGNLPIKHFYDTQMRYERFEYVPDFRTVTPIVLSNRTVGYANEGKYAFPYEYTYAQHLYFKDLGGVSSRRMASGTKLEEKLTNGFSLAPSYLSAAVRPWRSIKIIEDALLLQRMDLSTYMRIIGVKVGDQVFTKNAVRLLNFYREIFKKVRRVSFDGDGMSSSSFGNEFEVILPMTESQSIDIKDIGGQVDVRALRDLDIQYKKLFSSLRVQPSFIGFSDTAPSSLGESTVVNNWDERFGRLVKAVRLSTVKATKEIDKFFLRSRGYDVSERDWTYTFVAASTVEDEKRRMGLVENVKALTEMIGALEASQVAFNKDYLVKEYFSQAFSSSAVDTEKLFGDQKVQKKLVSSASRIGLEDTDMSLLVSSGMLPESSVAEKKGIMSSSFSDTHMAAPVVPYRRYLALGDSLASGSMVSLVPEFELASFDPGSAELVSVQPTVVTAVSKLYVKDELHSAEALSSGRRAEIDNLYLVNGGYYLEGPDLYNYLFMLDQGLDRIPVKRVSRQKEA